MSPSQPAHTRRYSAFISYRHADNTQEGRRWAEWLHRGLERYVVPPDLISTPNLRGDPIRDSLYPIFRDEDELPANADLATGIRAALEVSDHLIVLCSPRSAVSPWVRKEVREFKQLGRSDRILAIIIAGEPNADDPAKAREGILRDEECFCEELRFGAMRDDGTLDWTIRTEPLAADLRPNGTRAEGFVTAEAYREHLTLNSSLTPDKIATRTEVYRQQLDHALNKIIAGLLGVPLGQLKDRDAARRTALAEAEADKQRQIAERERRLAEQAQRSAEEAHRAKVATERTARRLAIAGAGALMLALLTGWFWWQAGKEKDIAVKAQNEADQQRAAAQTALAESNRQLERSQVEEGRAWLERGRAALNRGDHLGALMLAGRAIGYQGYGRMAQEAQPFSDTFPLLLENPIKDTAAEKERTVEAKQVSQFLDSVRPTHLPLWASAMSRAVTCVAFSPDGARVASGSDDDTIKLWDTVSGKEVATLRGHTNSVWSVAFSPDGSRLASGSDDNTIVLWDPASGKELATAEPEELAEVEQWFDVARDNLSPNKQRHAEREGNVVFIVPNPPPALDLTAPLRAGLVALPGREIEFPKINQPTPMLHVRQDTLAQLADPKLSPERRAELRMELCTKSSQFRAATALWQRLLQGEWPGFEGATVPKDQAPATIPADSPIRRLYLLALIDATKHPQIHGHPTICQTAAQIAPVLTKEMMATPTISLAMMSLMQALAMDDSPDISAPRAILMKRLDELATKE